MTSLCHHVADSVWQKSCRAAVCSRHAVHQEARTQDLDSTTVHGSPVGPICLEEDTIFCGKTHCSRNLLKSNRFAHLTPQGATFRVHNNINNTFILLSNVVNVNDTTLTFSCEYWMLKSTVCCSFNWQSSVQMNFWLIVHCEWIGLVCTFWNELEFFIAFACLFASDTHRCSLRYKLSRLFATVRYNWRLVQGQEIEISDTFWLCPQGKMTIQARMLSKRNKKKRCEATVMFYWWLQLSLRHTNL